MGAGGRNPRKGERTEKREDGGSTDKGTPPREGEEANAYAKRKRALKGRITRRTRRKEEGGAERGVEADGDAVMRLMRRRPGAKYHSRAG